MRNIKNSNFSRAAPRFLKLMVIVILSSTFIYGCSQIRNVTYPRDYVYLEKKEVHSKMALLGLYLRKMEEILTPNESISSENQAQILDLLTSINKTTESLLVGNRDTNHLVIDDHMDQFRSDVYAAIRGAKANPPNYFVAGQISGSCIACHKYRKF